MSGKENPKFEKIVKKIETIPSVKQEKKEILKLSPEEKAEQLWAFWNDYRTKKYEILTKERELPRKERRKIEDVEKLSELTALKERISGLWQDKRVQTLFKKHVEENLKQKEEISPDLKNYHQTEEELESSKEIYENILRDLFVRRGEEPDELTQIEIAENSAKVDIIEKNLDESFQENPKLASFIQYERLKDYHQQFEKDGFIWAPSRQELFEKILAHLVLLNKNRPMLLVGETGSGKTRLARAAVERLTNREAFEIGEEAKSDIRPLLGSASIEKGKTFITYGPLGQALTGKKTSLDKKSDGGGIFYMDEMNGYPPDALRSLIKQVSGRAPGERITFAAWRGVWEEIAEKSGLIGAANLPSEKHPDRAELPVEIVRELTTLEVDYPEQTKENPEFYEMMLACLMDKNGRIRLNEGELEPDWMEKVVPKTKEKIRELNPDPKSGGTLWRFAQLVGEIQKSFQHQENILTSIKGDASYLRQANFRIGYLLELLEDYCGDAKLKGVPLKKFLQEKLKKWVYSGKDESTQETFPEEDRALLKEFFAAYGLPIEGPDINKSDIKAEKIWSEKEIGFLSPRVPRPKEKIEAPKPVSKIAFLEDGTEIEYQAIGEPEELIIKGKEFGFIGKTPKGEAVLENREARTVKIVREEELENIKKESYLERIRKNLESLELGDLEKKISKIIDYLVGTLEPREKAKRREELEKGIKNLSQEREIDFILEQLSKTL
jgi:hypothetical protein